MERQKVEKMNERIYLTIIQPINLSIKSNKLFKFVPLNHWQPRVFDLSSLIQLIQYIFEGSLYQMPSNFNKETLTINKSKSKKVMEYVHLLSTHQEDNVRKIDKKTHQSKKQTQSKTNLNKELSSNKYHLDKEKFSLNLNQEIRKHTRSKTQYFKPFTQTTCPDDIYQDEPIASRYDVKKKVIKRQQSQKRIKSQSTKKLHPCKQSRNNLHQAKTKIKPQITKYVSTSIKPLNYNKKSISQHYSKQEQPDRKYISSINNNLNILREKLRKGKSTYSSKDKKLAKKLQDSKNMTFLNLSQILQRNDCNQDIFVGQNNKKNNKSERSMKGTVANVNQQNLKQLFSNLQQRIQYMTNSISETVKRHKNGINNKDVRRQKIEQRSFSFMENPVIKAKLRKSNFSTGQMSIGPDYDIQQLLKLKHITQSSIQEQIQMDLKSIKEMYKESQEESRPKTARVIQSRVIQSELISKEKTSARTYQKYSQNEQGQMQSNWSQKQSLLNLLTKYHEMTTQILPVISQLNKADSNQEYNPEIGQPTRMKRQSQEEENKKFLIKYNEIMEKNFKYQHVMNALIQDGIDVQKYMQGYLNRKT